MARKHAFALALALGLAAAVGAVAAISTVQLGAPARATPVANQNVVLRKRAGLLDRQVAALRQALAKRPPKLPKVPKYAPAAAPPAQVASTPVPSSGPGVASAPRVQYVRPAPIVVIKHRAHGEPGESEREAEGSGGGDD
jgi:hypothetical protein